MSTDEDNVVALAAKAKSLSPAEIAALSIEEKATMMAAVAAVASARREANQERRDEKSPKKQRGNRICKVCKKEFFPDHYHRRHCSRECKRAALYANPNAPKLNCHVCGNPFVAIQPTQKYCSFKCKELDRKTMRKCERCGKEFESRAAKYCSMDCRLGALSLNNPTSSKPYIEMQCLSCGQDMVVRNAARKFCSPLCHTEYRERQKATKLGQEQEQKVKFSCAEYAGHYVYAWLDNGAIFYIGRGCGRRVIEPHGESSCQAWRTKIGDRFSYAVIRDDLTEEGSMLGESILIELIQPPCNILAGMRRRERPPLTLPRTFASLNLCQPEPDPPTGG